MKRRRHNKLGRTRLILTTGMIIAAGLVCRLAPLGLDPFARKWSGSVLWGALFWCLAAFVVGGDRRLSRLTLAMFGCFASETLKLVHIAPLDTLRRTAAGGFLLGHVFSWYDMAAYLAGIILMELASAISVVRRRSRP
ncbi:DUF2809 domain-containing protein [Asaia siamensis]|nr:DUF2809 domain-containing protein [Asaia siamensis]GBR06849.1 hypothetical protein AA0323_1562 [Asaia siamensis NRIC 0323]